VNGRYELGAGIGYGGMAEVYRGRDVRMGRDVAIKVLRSDLARDPNFLKRFEREARSAAALEHPAIVRVYDTGEGMINGTNLPYIVMEFVEGRTLREVLQREGPINERRAMEITADICAALDYSHQKGIVHRDIKPANVMLTPTGGVKVMDFGIAKANNATSSTMTGTQAVIGTAQYLSPEQARGAKVDGRSDIYSTGVLFYELITGEPPFRGDNPVAVAYQHVREIPDPPSAHNPQISAAADAITLKTLEKEPDDRYATAGAMRDDLEAALAGRRVRAQSSMGRPTGGSAAATQVAGGRGGYRDDYRTGSYDRYEDTGSYQATSRYPSTGYDRGYDDPRGRGGYDDPRGRGGYDTRAGGYPDEYERFQDTGEPDRFGAGGYGGDGTGPATPKRNNLWKWVLAALAVVLTFVVVSLIATSLLSKSGSAGNGTASSSNVQIPFGLVGQPYKDVETRLQELGLSDFQITTKTTNSSSPDTLLAISPDQGATVPKTQKITMTVAAAPNSVQVPDVTGQTESQATQALENAGFTTAIQTDTDPTKYQAGQVVKTDPTAGSPAPSGSTVTLYVVSSQVTIPNEIGQQVAAAQQDLTSHGLNSTVQQQPDSTHAPGTVIDQNPKNAVANRGDTITLIVASAATPTDTASASPSNPLGGVLGGGGGDGNGNGSGGGQTSATPSPTPSH
jgi:serine/threonine-protein kinase